VDTRPANHIFCEIVACGKVTKEKLNNLSSSSMAHYFADPAACFFNIPVSIASNRHITEHTPAFNFGEIFTRADFVDVTARAKNLSVPGISDWPFSLHAPDEHVHSIKDVFRCPELHKEKGTLQVLEGPGVKLQRSEFRFCNLPDWIDTFSSRPELVQKTL
jgi:hypothetical protein